jgi:hypothetical protein
MFRVRTQISGGQGGPYLSTFYFDEIDGGATPQSVITATAAFWTSLRNVIDNSLTMRVEDEVALVNDGSGQVTGIVGATGATVTGDDAADPAPWATQGLIRWRTGLFANGREIRGRTFIPGVTEARSNGGVPDSSYLSNLTSAVNGLLGTTNAALMTWSRKNGDSAPVLSGSGWSQFAILRSRRD